MATISLFAISLGVAGGAARIMYAQARDATGKRIGLAGLTRKGTPGAALVVVLLIFAGSLVGQQLGGSSVVNATFYALQVGTVLILVYARLDDREYPAKIRVTDAELAAVNLHQEAFHPEWNYSITPRG